MDNDSRWRLLFIKKLEAEAVEAFQILRQSGIEPILIKGLAASRNFPKNTPRFYTDIDLAVAAADFNAAIKLIGAGSGTRISADLHCELRHLDTKDWTEVFNDSQEINLLGKTVRIPSAEDHLRILAVHWLSDGGAKKERLWDIYYAVKNRPAEFDWANCLNCVSEIRRQWIISAIGLAHKYLGLEIDDLPFTDRARVLPLWLCEVVEKEWKSGVPLKSLLMSSRDPREFLRQIRKRIPPNAIQATIELEGNFEKGSRLKYQVGSMLNRIGPLIRGSFVKLTQK
ncbi:MAG: hypothetical protein WBD27_15680 [Pyrinomonadaceae bacterium]